jgi:hypothetical protein
MWHEGIRKDKQDEKKRNKVCGGSMLLSLFTSRYNRERSGA